MKSYLKILFILFLSVFITIILAPIIASLLPFHLYRVTSRTVLVVTFILFYRFRETLGIHSIRSLGFSLNKWRWWRQLAVGFVLAVVSIGIISGVMIHTSIRFVVPDVFSIPWWKYLIGYLLAGFTVALIEEVFFRGFILQSLLKDSQLIVSLIITNIFYSAVHFLKPQDLPKVETLSLASSLGSISLFFKPLFTEWPGIWPHLLGLFLVGLVLSVAYLRTRSLALSIGLHAGWILGIKSLSLGTDVSSSGSLWVSGNIVGHPLGWGMMLLFLIILSVCKCDSEHT